MSMSQRGKDLNEATPTQKRLQQNLEAEVTFYELHASK